MEPQNPNWSELCPELLLEIADRLETRPDINNFRAVCKNWHDSLSRIPPLPFLSPLLPHKFLAKDSNFFSTLSSGILHHLVAYAVYLIRPRNTPESTKPWLLTAEEFRRGKLYIQLPLSKIRARGKFPSNVRIPSLLYMSDFHVSVIGNGYRLRSSGKERLSSNGGLNYDYKLVLFGNPACVRPLSIMDYTALVWFEHGRVGWVRLSRSSDWGFLAFQGISKFDDIVSFKERVYAIDRTGRMYVVHYELEWEKGVNFQTTLKMGCITYDMISSGCDSDRRKRLVVDSSGVLYVIKRAVYCCRIHFEVYKLDEENCKLDQVNGIRDDRILFVGVDCCFFASVADFPGFRGNCILFLDDSFPLYGVTTPTFFNGPSKELRVTVFHFEDGDAKPISACPGYSDILWPPSAWFYPEFSLP